MVVVFGTTLIRDWLAFLLDVLYFYDLIRGVVDDGLGCFSPEVVHHGDFSNRELEGDILVVESSLHADVVADKVPVGVDFAFPQDLSLQ